MRTLLDRFPVEHIPLSVELLAIRGYEVVFASTVGNQELGKKSIPDEIAFMGDFDISKGAFFHDQPWVLSAKEVDYLAQYEGLFIRLLSRFSLFVCNWSATEMADHYYRLCNFWKCRVGQYKIDVVFSFYEPHDPSSFSLYLTTKLLKVPYLFLDLPVIAGKIRFVNFSFSQRNLLLHTGNDGTEAHHADVLQAYFSMISSDFEAAMLPTMRKFYDNHGANRRTQAINKFFEKSFIGLKKAGTVRSTRDLLDFLLLVLRFFFPSPPIFVKLNRGLWKNQSNSRKSFFWFYDKYKYFCRVRQLKKSYLRVCSISDVTDLPEKYLLFAAPLEPEASSMPCALNGGSVERFIDQLLSALPEGARLVYRVNPAQFQVNYAFYSVGIDFHRYSYYDDLKEKGVIFCSWSIPMDYLISNSFAVSSINGTVGVEAVALGKPSVIAAPMWYDKAEGVHIFDEPAELKDFLNLAYLGKIYVDTRRISISGRNSFVFTDIGDPNGLSVHDLTYLIDRFAESYEDFLIISDVNEKVWSL